MFLKNDDDEVHAHTHQDCFSSRDLVTPRPMRWHRQIPFHNAVKCAISTVTDKIISSESDLVGVCFYGTVRRLCFSIYLSLSLLFVVSLIHSYNRAQQAEKKNLNEFEGIYVLHDLDLPDAQRILDLEALLGTLACSKHQAPPSPSASTHMPPRFSTLDSRLSAVGEENRFGHADHEFPFCDALWTCSTMFASSYVAVAALLLPHAAHS